MATVVMKFGGTSVSTPEQIKAIAKKLIARKNEGNKVVAVVSAMGKETDRLSELAHAISHKPGGRELDMLLTTGEQVTMSLLAMAIMEQGEEAVSYTGAQVGIITNPQHTRAKISTIHADRVKAVLDEGKIVVVAGFQGVTPDGEITTLGRGGSDTTAVAIATAIDADACEIYSDVAGVFTADPRIDELARKIPSISYEEMLELAASGSGVLQMRAVELARNYNVVLKVASSFGEGEGTIVKKADSSMESAIVSGIAHDISEAKVNIRHVPDRPGIAALVFQRFSESGVNVDMIIQDVGHDGVTDISFTCPIDDLDLAEQVLDDSVDELGAEGYSVDKTIAKVSIVGAGMRSNPGVAAKMFQVLYEAGVNILMISTSPIRISTVINGTKVKDAVTALHTAFDLDDDESIIDESK